MIWGFNPRPARGPGAAPGGGRGRLQPRQVSILAQPGGRALHCRLTDCVKVLPVSILAQPGGRALQHLPQTMAPSVTWFQSSPSPGAGRCDPATGRLRRDLRSFNPRPARGPGAALLVWSVGIRARGFQSSPSPGAGRCLDRARCKSATAGPVSILAQPGGRALPHCRKGCPTETPMSVSILAQPGGRALRCDFFRFRTSMTTVSILAQPGGRALPDKDYAADFETGVSILAQPGGRALPYGRSRPEPGEGFNPRPARGPGAARVNTSPSKLTVVSILAQPGGRALPIAGEAGDYFVDLVSILAQPGGRALQGLAINLSSRRGVVSILAQPGGRALRFASPDTHTFPAVSILAQPGGRALRPCDLLG